MKTGSHLSRTFVSMALLAASWALSPTAHASAPVKTVVGEYTYYGGKNDSPADCQRMALQLARIEALKEFGTIVSQNTFTSSSESNEGYETRFLSLSESEVKGEWLKDEGEPEFTRSFSDDGTLVVKCRVKGLARALSNEAADFETLVLRNGNDRKNADTNFRHDDDLYMYFSSPSNGYVSIFLQDESGDVYTLLPYPHSDVDRIRVKKGFDYVFFDTTKAGSDFGAVEPITVTTDGATEYNKVYVVFSPETFSAPPSRFIGEGLPPVTDGESFSKWLVKSRRNDPKMGVKSIMIKIDPDSRQTLRHT